MKKLLILLALAVGMTAGAQTYVNGSFSYYNGAGSFSSQGMGTVEVGRYLQDDFTAGIAVGTTSFSGGNLYAEVRPTFYYTSGKFSQGFTIGAGYVFNSSTPFMVEWATSTNFQFSKQWGVGVAVGGYNFNGKLFAADYSYFGTSVTYIFKRKKSNQ